MRALQELVKWRDGSCQVLGVRLGHVEGGKFGSKVVHADLRSRKVARIGGLAHDDGRAGWQLRVWRFVRQVRQEESVHAGAAYSGRVRADRRHLARVHHVHNLQNGEIGTARCLNFQTFLRRSSAQRLQASFWFLTACRWRWWGRSRACTPEPSS